MRGTRQLFLDANLEEEFLLNNIMTTYDVVTTMIYDIINIIETHDIVKNNHLMTTPLGTILNGITRQLIMEIAESAAIAVDEGYFTPEEVIEADEAFCTGTAVEIAPIASLNDRPIGGHHGKVGKVTQLILKNFNKITSGQTAIGALTYVDNSQVL